MVGDALCDIYTCMEDAHDFHNTVQSLVGAIMDKYHGTANTINYNDDLHNLLAILVRMTDEMDDAFILMRRKIESFCDMMGVNLD